jgi:hypothetical protein
MTIFEEIQNIIKQKKKLILPHSSNLLRFHKKTFCESTIAFNRQTGAEFEFELTAF